MVKDSGGKGNGFYRSAQGDRRGVAYRQGWYSTACCDELRRRITGTPEPVIAEELNQEQRFNRALTHLRSGDAASAAEVCERALKRFPGDANLLCLLAKAHLAQKRFVDAKSRLEEAIKLFPDFATAHETFGDFYLIRGRALEARRAYEQAMRLDPAHAAIHDKIDRARQLESQIARQSPEHDQESVPKRRMTFDAEIRKALEHERDGDLQPAETIYRDILAKDPEHVEAARLLAKIAVTNKRYSDAEVFLKKALSNAPDYVRAWVDLANVQVELHQFDDAVESASRVVRLAPDKAESHVLYAGAIGMAGDHEEAIRAYLKALEIAPDKAGAMCGMAHHQKTLGLGAEAIASYRRAIAAKPDHAESYWSLANLKTFRFQDEEVEAMEALLDRDDLPDESRLQIHNALGLELESREDFTRAFSNFEKCNSIRRKAESYDPVETESTYGRIIELFDKEFLSKNKGAAATEITPIFIVGLPRSGSTLIEQILASHSKVDGTHELGDLSRVVHGNHPRRKRGELFPEQFAALDVHEWAAIGTDYLERTEIFRGSAPNFVDKNPNNFVFTGFLSLAIPNAKIIDARRHPLDSCFGSYKQLFASGQPFCYDLTELGEYYIQYCRLMDHWHEVLPGFVLHVHYEQVVADLEANVRRILDFCGLPFEDACLRFHETERAVKTASSEQVRRPIYSSSVNLWRNYESQLETLINILEPVLRDRQEHDWPASLAQVDET